METKGIETLFQKLGVWGRWQTGQIAILQALIWQAAVQLINIVLVGFEPGFRCATPHYDNGSYGLDMNGSILSPVKNSSGLDKCDMVAGNETVPCANGFIYDRHKEASIVSEWDLICGDEYLWQLSQTILIAGQALGAILNTYISAGMLVASTALAFSPGIRLFMFFKFLIGYFQQAILISIVVMPAELTSMEHRAVMHMLSVCVWAFSQLGLTGLAYIFSDGSWRHLQFALNAPGLVIFILHLVFLDESVRWLLANGRTKDAKRITIKAARINKVILDDKMMRIFDEPPSNEETIIAPSDKETEFSDKTKGKPKQLPSSLKQSDLGASDTSSSPPKYSILDILRHRKLRCILIILLYTWIINNMVMNALVLTSSKMAGVRFMNFMYISLTSIPAGVISYLTMQWMGRKITEVIFHGIAGVALICAVLLQTFVGTSAGTAVTALSIVGNFGISGSFSALFYYTSELYPTTVDIYPWLPGTVFGSCCLVICVLMLFLPETVDKRLPQSIKEIDQWEDGGNACLCYGNKTMRYKLNEDKSTQF